MKNASFLIPMLLLGLLVGGCARIAVPVVGASYDIAALEGEWAGGYYSTETGRRGEITFTFEADADTAFGEVIMIAERIGDEYRPYLPEFMMREAGPYTEGLKVRFVQVTGNEVSGELESYKDPDCGCTLHTTFKGWIRGDEIDGSFSSHHQEMNHTVTGAWSVKRK